MKRKTTKEILAESFRELSVQKAVDKITIKEITDNCGYSPATFYRQFKDKYDLIAWEHTRGVAAIMGQIGDAFSWKQAFFGRGEAVSAGNKAVLRICFCIPAGRTRLSAA